MEFEKFNRKSSLLVGDAVIVFLGLFLGTVVRFSEPMNFFRMYTGATIIFGLTFLCSFYVFDLYNIRDFANGSGTLILLCVACALSTLVCSSFFYFLPGYRYGRGIFVMSALFVVLFAYLWRKLFQKYGNLFPRAIPTVVMGIGRNANAIQRLVEHNESAYKIVGFLRMDSELPESAVPVDPVLGTMSDLSEITRDYNVACLVMASDLGMLTPVQAGILTRTKFSGVRIIDASEFYMRLAEVVPLDLLTDSWLWFSEGFELVEAQLARKVKRLADLLMALVGLVFGLPVILLTTIAIKLDSPGPVFYRQKRVGRYEKSFQVLKFRSMRTDAELDGKPQWAKFNDPRVTRLGQWLRRLHIDEIPQMFNVLKGDMSFVGPRPERPEFAEQLKIAIPFYPLRHYINPGITGWAQVNYPYGASIDDAKRKLEYDLYYIAHSSLFLDLRIILRTIRVIIFRTGSR